ncbi:MAG: hypothetical protein ACYTJ0_20145 [Planctomycetota bacterium]|jgi:hypothetical protein
MRDEHVELLISRLAGDEAGPEGWNEFAEVAASRPELWHELALAQRDQVTLARMVTHAGDVADAVEVPDGAGAATRERWRPGWVLAMTGWTGWAVAASMVAAILIARPGAPRSPAPPTTGDVRTAATTPASVDDAFEAYLQAGRASGQVVGEMPTKVLIETRPGPQGQGFEVLYLRGVLERTTVPDLYHFEGQNEQGRPSLVRWQDVPGEPM